MIDRDKARGPKEGSPATCRDVRTDLCTHLDRDVTRRQSMSDGIDIWKTGLNLVFASPTFRLRGILCDGSANNHNNKRKLRRALP
jgi:hypothetical protein